MDTWCCSVVAAVAALLLQLLHALLHVSEVFVMDACTSRQLPASASDAPAATELQQLQESC
jgi:hypothetical protein